MPHLRIDTLEKYLLRRLTPARIIRVEEHLLVCSSCRGRLDESDAFLRDLKDAANADAREHGERMTVGNVA